MVIFHSYVSLPEGTLLLIGKIMIKASKSKVPHFQASKNHSIFAAKDWGLTNFNQPFMMIKKGISWDSIFIRHPNKQITILTS